MEDFSLSDILNIFRGKLLLIIIIISLVTTSGMTYVLFLKTPLYSSETTMVLTAPTNSSASTSTSSDTITQSDILLNQKLVSTYSEIIRSKKVINKVINNLSIKNTVDEVSEMITVSSINDTEMLQIKVLNADPVIASKIANNIADVFSKEIVEIYNIQNVSIIDSAEVSKMPSNINIIKEILIFFAIGIILGLGVSFLIYLLDTTVKNPEEVESKLGLPILTVIPVQKR